MLVREYVSDARAREKPCLRCGLSLRKHLDDRHCPQCGLSVWMSLNSNESLDYSNARWLRKASRGAWVMAGVQVLAFLAYLAGLVSIGAATTSSWQRTSAGMQHAAAQRGHHAVAATQVRDDEDPAAAWEDGDADPFEMNDAATVPLVIATGLAGVYFVCEAGGLVLMAVHEERYPDRAKTIRLAARIAAGFAGVLGVGLLALAVRTATSRHEMDPMLAWVLLFVVEIVFAGCAFVSWFWLRPIARRAGKSSLAKLCGYLLFLPILPFLKAAPFLGLWMFSLFAGPLLHLLPLVYIPLSVYLFARGAVLLNRAIPHAEAAWAAETKLPG